MEFLKNVIIFNLGTIFILIDLLVIITMIPTSISIIDKLVKLSQRRKDASK